MDTAIVLAEAIRLLPRVNDADSRRACRRALASLLRVTWLAESGNSRTRTRPDKVSTARDAKGDFIGRWPGVPVAELESVLKHVYELTSEQLALLIASLKKQPPETLRPISQPLAS